jgi:hypothetical protein
MKIRHPPQKLSVPGRLRPLPQQLPRPNLPPLIRHRIVQSMRPHIPPEPIEPVLFPRSPRPQNLKHPTRNLKPNIRANDFPARDQSRQLTAPSGRNSTPRGRVWRAAVHDVFEECRAVLPALAVDGGEL